MPRKATWPPRITRHASDQARVRVGSKDYYLGVHGSPEAAAAYARLVTQLAAGQVPVAKSASPPLTVADVIARWWEQEAPRWPESSSVRVVYRLALAVLDALYGPTPAAEFGATELEVVQLAMATGSWLTADGRKRGLKASCRTTVAKRLVKIRSVWRWAERRELVPRGSHANLRTVPGLAGNDPRVRHPQKRRAATWGELLAVCRQVQPGVRTMLLLMWWSGMRSGEARILRPTDIDRSGPVWLYRPQWHKTAWRGQEKVIALGPKCQALLEKLLATATPDAYLFPPSRKRKDGKPFMSGHVFAQVVRRAARKAGVPGFTSYKLRHAARLRITRTLNLDAARAVLGHQSFDQSAAYEAAVDLETACMAAQRCG